MTEQKLLEQENVYDTMVDQNKSQDQSLQEQHDKTWMFPSNQRKYHPQNFDGTQHLMKGQRNQEFQQSSWNQDNPSSSRNDMDKDFLDIYPEAEKKYPTKSEVIDFGAMLL